MIINILGECDKRPVTYTIMKILQEFGDVLYVTNESHAMRLSDTRMSAGHYQNVMVAVTDMGFDDFFNSFDYMSIDFENTIVEGLACTDADLAIYVEGITLSIFEQEDLAYVDDYKTIHLYKQRLYDSSVTRKVEEFEACGIMCPMSQKIAGAVVAALEPLKLAPSKSLMKAAMHDRVAAHDKKIIKKK